MDEPNDRVPEPASDAPSPEAIPGSPPEAPGRRRWPSDYYGEPPSQPAATRPSGLVVGCAVLSLGALLIITGGAWWLGSGGVTKVMKFVFASTEKQVDIISTGVPDQARNALKEELRRMGSDVENGRVAMKDVQAVQQTISRTIRDSRLTAAETSELTKALRETPRKRR